MKTRNIFLILTIVLPMSVYGQKSFVTGKVTDTNQQPVKGAILVVDGSETGKKTNKQGNYKVKIDPGAKIIAIKDQAGQSQEMAIDGKQEINFTVSASFAVAKQPMQPEVTGEQGPADEQVNIGYGTVSKRNLTTPVTKVNAGRGTQYVDIYEMLRGKPGVQVVGKTIKIQGGVNSINLSSDPLLVVDGIVVNSIDDIKPIEVSSIEVLKGSAASIYGSRGANGVILINLKK
jgi:TonB-dependent starch-binding outer membrane protein SusC